MLFLKIFMAVLKCVKTVHGGNVTHYDLKCDNVLLDVSEEGCGVDGLPEVTTT